MKHGPIQVPDKAIDPSYSCVHNYGTDRVGGVFWCLEGEAWSPGGFFGFPSLTLSIYIYTLTGDELIPRFGNWFSKRGGGKNIGGSRKSINEEAGVAEIPLQRSGCIYIYIYILVDELDARDAFECLGSSLIGVDLARIERRNKGWVGWERLCFGKRINEASNRTPFENWRDWFNHLSSVERKIKFTRLKLNWLNPKVNNQIHFSRGYVKPEGQVSSKHGSPACPCQVARFIFVTDRV